MVIRHVKQHPEQRNMRNSYQQAHNVLGVFSLREGEVLPIGPVLLVDDIVDSKWTLTVVGDLLLRNGCAATHPFVLANMSAS